MSKLKYYVVFVLVALCAGYQLLLSFNAVPFLFSGQDLFAVILLLVALSQLFLARSVQGLEKSARGRDNGMVVRVDREAEEIELADPEQIEEKHLLKYILNVQNYFKGVKDKRDTIAKTMVAAAKITRSRRASVLLYDPKTADLYIHKTIGWDSTELKLSAHTRIKPGEGIAGRVFQDGSPFVMNQTDEKAESDPKRKYRSSAYACFPLVAGQEVIGVLNLTEKESGIYSRSEIDMISFVMNEASLHLMSR